MFSRVGGLNGDPAAVALAALPPLELGASPGAGDALTSLPNLLDGAPLAGIADADLGSLLGSTSLAGGLPIGGGSIGLGSLTGGVGSIIDTATGSLGIGVEYPTSVLGSVGDLLNGGDPAAAVSNAVGATVGAVGHLGSGAAMTVGEASQVLERPLTETLNGSVAELHAGIENAAHSIGLSHTLHGVTQLGETVGLGELGGENLLTEVVGLPGALASGQLTAPVEAVTGHLGEIVDATANIVSGLTTDIENVLGHSGEGTDGGTLVENALGVLNGGDPIGGVSHLAASVGETVDPLLSGVTGAVGQLVSSGESPLSALNLAVGELHVGLETAGYASGLAHTVHGVTNLGETIGLGEIGGENLVTDLLTLPADLGGGDPAAVLGEIVDHAGAIVPAATNVVNGVVGDVDDALGSLGAEGSGSLLTNVVDLVGGEDPLGSAANAVANAGETVGYVTNGALGAVEALGGLGETSPTDTLNNVVDELHAGLEHAAHSSGLNETIHGVTNLGGTIGLGEIGGENLVTDVVELPGEILGGGDPAGSIGGIVEHASAIVPAAEGVVTGVVDDLTTAIGGSLPGVGGGLPLPGVDALPLPGVGGGSLPLPGIGGGADSLVGTIEDTVHSVAGGALPAPVAPILGGDLDLGHPTDLGGLTDIVHTLPVGTPEHHSGGLGLGLI